MLLNRNIACINTQTQKNGLRMNLLIVLIMVLTCIAHILKQTYMGLYISVVYSAVSALFIYYMWPFAIEQSTSRISDWLSDSALMLNVAVILVINVIVQISFCVLDVQIGTSTKVYKKLSSIYNILRWMPDLLIFPVLFWLLVSAIFSFPGRPFRQTAAMLSVVVFVAVPALVFAIKRLLPNSSIRLELLFLANVLIAILGIVASVNGETSVACTNQVNWAALAGTSVLAISGVACGIIYHTVKKR